MLRFPNPGSTLSNFVAVYSAAFEKYRGQVVDLDNIVQATVEANLATSSGHMGGEAIARSTRKDRSRDPLYNQLKMYAELFRSLGWLRSTEHSALNYTFTLLGEQIVAAGREWRALLGETVIGIAYPSHVLDLRGEHHIRPFATILKTMAACNNGLSRDEMILGPLSASSDRTEAELSDIADKVMALRERPSAVIEALNDLRDSRGIQINTLKNYTRWPLAVLRDLGWTEKEREPFRSGNKTFEIHRLTALGQAKAESLREAIDLRIDQIDQLSFPLRRTLARKAHFMMMDRAGFDISTVAEQLDELSDEAKSALEKLGIPSGSEFLFSPFQSLSISDSSRIFPTPEAPEAERHVQDVLDGLEVGRGSREHLFVAPHFVQGNAGQDGDLDPIRQELVALHATHGSISAAAREFARSRVGDTQTLFYPLVTLLLRLMGFRSDYSRAGVNYQRWDACVWLNDLAVPIEIKSPTEEMFLSTKAIRQAIENKVILLSRGGLETRREFSTLVVGFQIPNERGDMSMLIDDVHAAFGFKIGVLDLETLTYLAIKAVTEGVTIEEEQLSHLKGFLDV